MNSHFSDEGLAVLRAMPEEGKADLTHVCNNASCIISVIAQQLLDDPDPGVRARMRVILKTVDDLSAQIRLVTEIEPCARAGAEREE